MEFSASPKVGKPSVQPAVEETAPVNGRVGTSEETLLLQHMTFMTIKGFYKIVSEME